MEKLTNWKLVYTSFRAEDEKLRESLCTLGNGYVGVRGACLHNDADDVHYPGTYVSGLYNTLSTYISGKTVYNEDLVNLPNGLFLTFKIEEGDWFSLSEVDILSFRQELNIKEGVLSRKIKFKDKAGHITLLNEKRIVSMVQSHLTSVRLTIKPLNYSKTVTVKSKIDGTVINWNVKRYRKLNSKHLKISSLKKAGSNYVVLNAQTNQSKVKISEAAKIRVFDDKRELKPKITVNKIEGKVGKAIEQEFSLNLKKLHSYTIEKNLVLYISSDKGVKNPGSSAVKEVKSSARFEKLLEKHIAAWSQLWEKFDIKIKRDVSSQFILRWHIFHLLQTASFNTCDMDVGFSARGLHGEAYRGHIFWDELFVLFFYNLHFPEISKSILLYRYRRLKAARKYAEDSGFKGAMFPWQSGSSGKEESQELHLNPVSGKWGPDYSRRQRHISFDIAHNVWQYWRHTDDLDFLNSYGAEIILSVAQFGASLARYNKKDGRYHTYGVMGPDEFHEKYSGSESAGLTDNAYTNFMIVWTLMKAEEILSAISSGKAKSLKKKLGLTGKEIDLWRDIKNKMKIIISKEGIIEQFKDYFKLKEVDWKKYKKKYGDIHRMDRILKAEGKSPDSYKVSKQADVLMIFYLFSLREINDIFNQLGYPFRKSMLRKNFDYYEKRTSHGSSLSRVVHGFIAQLLGKKKRALKWFQEVMDTDIHDIQGGTTPEGIHTGTMGGSIDIVMKCFAGIHLSGDQVCINPNLPQKWTTLDLSFLYRKVWFSLSISKNKLKLFLDPTTSTKNKPVVKIGNRTYTPSFKKTKTISLKDISR